MSRMSSRLGFRPDEFDEERYVDVDRRGFRRVPPVYDYYDGGTPPMTFSGKATKYPNFTDLSRSGEPKVEKADQEKTRQQPPPLSAEFAENTTLQGIAYIHRSKKWYRAIFWVIIFLAAVAATVYQTYTVVHKYYSYGTTTSVGMGYDKLPFPSVAICNINPIRLSASSDFSDELDDFLATIVPDNSYDKQRSAPTTTSPPDGDNKRVKRDLPCGTTGSSCVTSDEGVFDPENTPDVDQVSPTPRPAPHNGFETLPEDNLAPGNTESSEIIRPTAEPATSRTTTAKTNTTRTATTKPSGTTTTTTTTTSNIDTMKAMAGCKTGDPRCGSVISPCAETDTECKAKYPSLYGKGDFWKGSNYSSSYEKYDDFYNDDDGDADDDDDDDDDYGSGEISRSLILSERLKEILSELSREERTELGHQAENMILDCEFNGRKCYYWDTVQYLSGEYGNCYTFNSAFIRQRPYKARQSGASYGFTVILYLEGHDYIPNLSQGRGMRIVVHPFKTMPFAVQNGKSLKPGEETYVGIRMTTLSRKGKPYGECGDNGSFTELFGYKYTIDGCLNTCLARAVFLRCGCYMDTDPELYNPSWASESEPCESDDQMKCVFKFVNKYQQGKLDCQCNAACKTIEYNIEMSHNTWPDVSLWYDLVNIVCERSEEGCNALKEAGGDTDEQKTKVLRENFLRLHIYFQDLNYQKIEEVPEYEMEQFLSDLGGTMGLWVGASFITLMELFYFVIWLLARTMKKDQK